jgi:hypothetical protein
MRLGLVLITVVSLSTILTGCSGDNDETKPTSKSTICVDNVVLNGLVLHSEVDAKGAPVSESISESFEANTNNIYATVYLSDDVCCQTFTVQWFYPDDESTHLDSYTSENNFTSILPKQQGIYPLGQYRVVVTSDLKEIASVLFLVV